MIREKVKLPKKRRREEEKSISDSNKVNKLFDKNGIFMNKKCIEDLNLKKRTIIKKDGRYLIYYTF